MAVKTLQIRVQDKHDTSENWVKAVGFIPLPGEIIIYDDLRLMKVGDGVTDVNFLPFMRGHNEKLTIGKYEYDGSAAVTVPTYEGSEEK